MWDVSKLRSGWKKKRMKYSKREALIASVYAGLWLSKKAKGIKSVINTRYNERRLF